MTQYVVGNFMSLPLITCGATTTLLEAVTLMTRNHIHRLVVANSDADRVYPLGILSMTDVIRYLIKDPATPTALQMSAASPTARRSAGAAASVPSSV